MTRPLFLLQTLTFGTPNVHDSANQFASANVLPVVLKLPRDS
jgi:hypothetical protein